MISFDNDSFAKKNSSGMFFLFILIGLPFSRNKQTHETLKNIVRNIFHGYTGLLAKSPKELGAIL